MAQVRKDSIRGFEGSNELSTCVRIEPASLVASPTSLVTSVKTLAPALVASEATLAATEVAPLKIEVAVEVQCVLRIMM